MMNVIAIAATLAAIVLLGAALAPTWRLLRELPAGPTRDRWRLLAGANALLLFGCGTYLAMQWDRDASLADLLVPVILVLAAGYAVAAAQLSLGTAIRVRGISSADRLAVTAALAGEPGPAYLDQRMREEVSRARRHGLAVSVLLIDIDDFGSINREFGHSAGDRVLTDVGRIVAESLRGSDVKVRYAGEELTVILPHTPPRAAYTVAERLRGAIGAGARQALRDVLGARRAITVSIGIAGRETGQPLDGDLFEAANGALEQAKAQGYNRVELAAAPSDNTR